MASDQPSREVTGRELLAQLASLGVRSGDTLLVHSSYRAIRPVQYGPLGVIAALRELLGPTGNLVMPTMTDGESRFDPRVTPSSQMGVVAELFWRQPGVVRSGHPGASFAAAGPDASFLCSPQPLSPPHGPDSPVGRVHDLNGKILLLGVTHSENTSLHLAEALAQVPYRVEHPCVVERDARLESIMIAETDHCCTRFQHADAWLREQGLQREGRVGHAHARLCAARDLVAIAVGKLASDPLLFLCPAPLGCSECDRARASIDGETRGSLPTGHLRV